MIAEVGKEYTYHGQPVTVTKVLKKRFYQVTFVNAQGITLSVGETAWKLGTGQ